MTQDDDFRVIALARTTEMGNDHVLGEAKGAKYEERNYTNGPAGGSLS